ncbi:MAG: hypothetical protein KAR22_04315 [Gammaproteobacteria bacterium]|nr:hypothetical protein [Gammaproteobacteria bacterium]
MEDVQHAATPRSAAGSSRADSESLPVWKISATPEALKLSVDDLSASIEAIPNLVTSERQAVLAALDDKESALTGTVAKLRGALTEAIAVLHQVEALAATAERTVAGSQQTIVALTQILATSERLIDRIEKDGAGRAEHPAAESRL